MSRQLLPHEHRRPMWARLFWKAVPLLTMATPVIWEVGNLETKICWVYAHKTTGRASGCLFSLLELKRLVRYFPVLFLICHSAICTMHLLTKDLQDISVFKVYFLFPRSPKMNSNQKVHLTYFSLSHGSSFWKPSLILSDLWQPNHRYHIFIPTWRSWN